MQHDHPASPSPAARWLLFALLGSVGGFIAALYFRVIPWRPPRHCTAIFCDPYHWQVLCFGLAFFLAGLAVVIPSHWRRLGRLSALAFVATLLAALVGSFAAR